MDAITNVLMDFFRWINDAITGNFGLTIILFTILFRLVCLPLDFYSRKGQRDFSKKTLLLQPEIDQISKAYKNDPQKMQMKTMEARKRAGIGMMPKGCFTQLLVYPLLIAFFAVFRNMAAHQTQQLSEWVAQYGADAPEISTWFNENSFLWIRNIWMPDNAFNMADIPVIRVIPLIGSLTSEIVPSGSYLAGLLSAIKLDADTVTMITDNLATLSISGNNGLYILPILAGAMQFLSMKVTTKLSPQPAADPANPQAASGAKMTKFMNIFFPIMFVYFCLTSSSALAIYWVTSSMVMMGTNYAIAKFLDYRDNKKAGNDQKPEEKVQKA